MSAPLSPEVASVRTGPVGHATETRARHNTVCLRTGFPWLGSPSTHFLSHLNRSIAMHFPTGCATVSALPPLLPTLLPRSACWARHLLRQQCAPRNESRCRPAAAAGVERRRGRHSELMELGGPGAGCCGAWELSGQPCSTWRVCWALLFRFASDPRHRGLVSSPIQPTCSLQWPAVVPWSASPRAAPRAVSVRCAPFVASPTCSQPIHPPAWWHRLQRRGRAQGRCGQGRRRGQGRRQGRRHPYDSGGRLAHPGERSPAAGCAGTCAVRCHTPPLTTIWRR